MNTTAGLSQPTPLARRPAEGVHVLLVGSRPVVREGLGRCLRARGCQVLGEAHASADGVSKALRLRPHVVVVDGASREHAPFDFARSLLAADRRQRVLMVACHDDPAVPALTADVVERAWDSGIHGLVDGSSDGDQLARAVDLVRLGGRHLPPRPAVVNRQLPPGTAAALSKRERQVLALIAQGYSTTEAGQRLVLSPATVKHHLSSAHRKLGARSRVEAVMFALTRGLIDVNPADVEARRQITRSAPRPA